MAADKDNIQLLLEIVKGLRQDLVTFGQEIREDHRLCRAHCDSVVSEQFVRISSLEQSRDRCEGAQEQRRDHLHERVTRANEGQSTYTILGAIILAVTSILVAIGSSFVTLWFMKPGP